MLDGDRVVDAPQTHASLIQNIIHIIVNAKTVRIESFNGV